MAQDPKRRTLGRGLSALLGDENDDYAQLDRMRPSRFVSVDQLRPSPFQPRRHLTDDGLQELARSIAEKGVLQPLVVRRVGGESQTFEIVAGERRWRAAQLAQLHEVPVIVKELTDGEALEIALIENLQRQDLNPIEEAEGYRRLMAEFRHSQEDLARVIGKSRSHVANTLRLLSLPDSVKMMLETGALTAGHARALVGAENADVLAQQVVSQGLNVRQAERLVGARRPAKRQTQLKAERDPDTRVLEQELSAALGLQVEIHLRGSGGTLVLHYRAIDQLDDILHRLSQGRHGRPAPQ